MINYHITVSGLVQGVGFRWSTLNVARNLGLVGFVQNLSTGQVYIEVQGASKDMHLFLKKLREGITPYAHVESVKVQASPLADWQHFDIH